MSDHKTFLDPRRLPSESLTTLHIREVSESEGDFTVLKSDDTVKKLPILTTVNPSDVTLLQLKTGEAVVSYGEVTRIFGGEFFDTVQNDVVKDDSVGLLTGDPKGKCKEIVSGSPDISIYEDDNNFFVDVPVKTNTLRDGDLDFSKMLIHRYCKSAQGGDVTSHGTDVSKVIFNEVAIEGVENKPGPNGGIIIPKGGYYVKIDGTFTTTGTYGGFAFLSEALIDAATNTTLVDGCLTPYRRNISTTNNANILIEGHFYIEKETEILVILRNQPGAKATDPYVNSSTNSADFLTPWRVALLRLWKVSDGNLTLTNKGGPVNAYAALHHNWGNLKPETEVKLALKTPFPLSSGRHKPVLLPDGKILILPPSISSSTPAMVLDLETQDWVPVPMETAGDVYNIQSGVGAMQWGNDGYLYILVTAPSGTIMVYHPTPTGGYFEKFVHGLSYSLLQLVSMGEVDEMVVVAKTTLQNGIHRLNVKTRKFRSFVAIAPSILAINASGQLDLTSAVYSLETKCVYLMTGKGNGTTVVPNEIYCFNPRTDIVTNVVCDNIHTNLLMTIYGHCLCYSPYRSGKRNGILHLESGLFCGNSQTLNIQNSWEYLTTDMNGYVLILDLTTGNIGMLNPLTMQNQILVTGSSTVPQSAYCLLQNGDLLRIPSRAAGSTTAANEFGITRYNSPTPPIPSTVCGVHSKL